MTPGRWPGIFIFLASFFQSQVQFAHVSLIRDLYLSMLTVFSGGDLRFLLFPLLLFVYYLICWFRVGKDPKVENVSPQYEPPSGISPGLARYIITGGSDGTTLAAVLAHLAAKGVIAIQPQSGSYSLELVEENASVQPEETALVQVLFTQLKQPDGSGGPASASQATAPRELREAVNRIPSQQLASQGLAVAAELAATPRQKMLLDPKSAYQVKLAIDAIQESFRKNVQGLYFRWNAIYALAGIAVTFAFGLLSSFFVESSRAPSTFLTLWLLFFTSVAGTVLVFWKSSRPTQPTASQRMNSMVILLFFFVVPGFLIGAVAIPTAKWLVLALLLAVALNSAFLVIMRAPTEKGQEVLEQLAGFREFLVRVEQDRLERINTPEEKARMMNRFLPYAIAMGVKEGWGDTMAAAFSNAIVER
jgi:hypothetical protein